MSKYKSLTDFLSNLEGESFMTNFAALEDILGFELPASARQYPAWWANQDRGQSLAWQSAGWKTMDVAVELGTVTFVRGGSETESAWRDLQRHLTIAQAKAGLAKAFGVSPDCIEITIRA
jgi:hypothetical protein